MSAQRRDVLAAALGAEPTPEAIAAAGERGAYLARAVLTAAIPPLDVVAADRRALVADPAAWLRGVEADAARMPKHVRRLPVRLVDGVLIDVTDTVESEYTTGIQRVARGVVAAWPDEPRTLGAMDRLGVLRTVDDTRARRAGASRGEAPAALVPVSARLLLPEIAIGEGRAPRLASIARFGAVSSVAVGHDCIPMTTAETAPLGMPAAFAGYLAGLARFSTVAATSPGSLAEFAGWRRMLPAAGLRGPEVVEVPLPCIPIAADPEPEAVVREAAGAGDRPIVLVVGTHEPRKNHRTVLAAAELAWRAGADFRLVFVGGRSWDSKAFDREAGAAIGAGRPISILTGVPDARLAGLYRAATVSVFVSYNEGYGLPVAESLAAGTPVIASGFGAIAAIGHGQAILVDPRDPSAIAEAIGGVLADPQAARAGLVPPPPDSWARYARGLAALL